MIRGGTDGSRLSFMGLPTPNLFAGEHNFHSRLEWVSAQDMEKAVEVIVALCAATNQPIPEENALLRESFLQAAAFVGREREFNTLHTALQNAVTENGKGAAWHEFPQSRGPTASSRKAGRQRRQLCTGVAIVR